MHACVSVKCVLQRESEREITEEKCTSRNQRLKLVVD